ncbi:hypothetical protein EJ08DRAFT_380881 [Tothia fuscella]|uniref:Uncharacterized protein n=1 Tax=Tothia fuscella TaxID=1048955 RepID=A0A9P4NLF3_9PEZI|nr:hypothetical protein EJ08DRAFT_380881 [Tothia fuscella]
MNDPRRMQPMNLPYRYSPPNPNPNANRRAPFDQQRRAAAYSQYNDYEYDYDTMPANEPRARRPMDNTPRSHPPGFQDGIPRGGPPPPPLRQPTMQTQPPHPKLMFGQAAQQLHSALIESKKFYETFLAAFTQDTEGVKKYARAPALELLWQDKIEADIYPNGRQTGPNGAPLLPPPPGSGPINFGSVTRKLRHALFQACNAKARRPTTGPPGSIPPTPAPGQSASAEDDANSLLRLVKKLKSQWQDLNELMGAARKNSKMMWDLIKELEMLLKVLEDKRAMWEKYDGVPVHHYGAAEHWGREGEYYD